jgi:hypothetical protein
VTLTEQYALASDDAFIGKVMICVAKAAIAISGEVCGGSEQPSNAAHAKRAKWAMEALLPPRTMAEKMAVGVAANGTITIASEDADIEWTVSSIIDDYAGVD